MGVFSGETWPPRNMLPVWLEASVLLSRPSGDASIAFPVGPAGSGADGFRPDTLLACGGSRVEPEGRCRDRRPRGWTTDVRASQVTTCP